MLPIVLSLLLSVAADQATFLKAVSTRDIDSVKSMLAADPSLVDAQSPKGVSAVITAMFGARKGEEAFLDPKINEVVQTILEHKPKFGLFETAAFGTAAQLEALLRDDPQAVMRRNSFGWTPLHLSAFAGNVATSEVLLARGADVNVRAQSKFKNTPLQTALLSGQYATTKLLLDHGADVLVRQAEGFAPLHEAAQQGRRDLVTLLLERGAETASRADDGTTARDIALKGHHDEVAALLK